MSKVKVIGVEGNIVKFIAHNDFQEMQLEELIDQLNGSGQYGYIRQLAAGAIEHILDMPMKNEGAYKARKLQEKAPIKSVSSG